MDQNQPTGLATVSNGDSSFHNLIDRNRLTGLATILVGISQLPLAFMFAEHWPSFFVIGSGGALLIRIGIHVFQGRGTFETGWGESEWVAWLSTVVLFIFAVAVATGTVWVLFV